MLNLEKETEEYKDAVKNLMSGWSYGKWSLQDGSSPNIVMYSRRDHE
jgi:hypothetical protein